MGWIFNKRRDAIEVLAREKFEPIHLLPGDSLALTFNDNDTKKVLCRKTITAEHAMTMDEAVLFATVFEGRRALGGMALEQQ